MENNQLNKPIFIIGAARSGTSLLGDLIGKHKDIAFWLEPKYIWRYGNPSAKDDYRGEDEVTEKIAKYIKSQFEGFLRKAKKRRFAEKTPSNVFRVPFIFKIFPDAKFVNIIRDGRDVVLSAEQKWTKPPARSAIIRRLVRNEITLSEWPSYIISFLRDVPGRFLFPSKGFIWGPYFKGIQEYRQSHTVLETCAKQWTESVSEVQKALQKIPTDQVLNIRYEELMIKPEEVLGQIFNFLDLEFVASEWREEIKGIKPRGEYTDEEEKKIELIEHIIKSEQEQLGYQ